MFNVGGGEVLVILLIALIILGPDKLPDAARQAGKFLGDFRRMSGGFQRELRDAIDLNDLTGGLTGTPKTKPTSPGGPTEQTSAAPAGGTPAAESGGPSSPSGVPSPSGTDSSPASANGATASDATAATKGNAATDGAAASETATTDGVATNGDTIGATPTVRKRSIEVDGPSSSFG